MGDAPYLSSSSSASPKTGIGSSIISVRPIHWSMWPRKTCGWCASAGLCWNQGQVYFASSTVYVTSKRSATGCWLFVLKLCGYIVWENVLFLHYSAFTRKKVPHFTASLKGQNKERKCKKYYTPRTFANLYYFAYMLCLQPETTVIYEFDCKALKSLKLIPELLCCISNCKVR